MAHSRYEKDRVSEKKFWLGEDEQVRKREKAKLRENSPVRTCCSLSICVLVMGVISFVAYSAIGRSSSEIEQSKISKVEISAKNYNLDTNIQPERNKLILSMFPKKDFPKIETALANSEKILDAMKSRKNQKQLDSMKDSPVAFFGSISSKPKGDHADLLIGKNILLKVKLKPQADPRPKAIMWTAIVYGVLKSSDVKKGIVRIQSTKKNWRVVETW